MNILADFCERGAFIQQYSKVQFYICQLSDLGETFKFIKEVQQLLNSKGLGSQVMISDSKVIEETRDDYLIRNCFQIEKGSTINPENFCLTRPVIGIFFKGSSPDYSPQYLIEMAIEEEPYEDEYLEIKIIL